MAAATLVADPEHLGRLHRDRLSPIASTRSSDAAIREEVGAPSGVE
jgi:hypothetical protein